MAADWFLFCKIKKPVVQDMLILRLTLSFLLVLLAPFCAWADPVFPRASSVGLEPPAGMAVADDFLGFQAGKASIVIIEMPKVAYPQINGNRQRLAEKFVAAKAEDFSVAGAQGFIIRGTQEVAGQSFRKWALVLDASAQTAMVTVQVPAEDDSISDAAVETALRSIALRDRPGLPEQIAALPFVVGDSAGFRPVAVIAGAGLLLTEGPKDVDPDAAQPVVVISTSLQYPPPAAQRSLYARNVLKTVKDMKNVEIISEKLFEAGGAQWAEIRGKVDTAKSDTPIAVSFFMRFGEGSSLLMVQTARITEQKRYAERVRRLALSVKPRN